MGVLERREREKQALRQEILSAARELFANEGYESVSMRKIAEKIEYSPTTIYLYFRDKQEVVQEICTETFLLLTQRLNAVSAESGDAMERLQAGMRAYVEFGLEHPDHYRVSLMMPFKEGGRDSADAFNKSEGVEAFRCLTRSMAECVRAGRIQNADVMAVSQVMWVSIHGLTSLLITHGEHFPWIERDRLIDMTIKAAVKGFA
jgi:AcrR family transcriptional regulator